MKKILFFLSPAILLLSGCLSAKKSNSSMITQGITGFVTESVGNQMPMVDGPKRVPQPIRTTVFVYEPTNISQVTRSGTSPVYTAISTKLVASIETDSTGAFTVALPVGSYSLFIKQGSQFFASLFDTNNNIALFTVEAGKLTTARLNVNNSATF